MSAPCNLQLKGGIYGARQSRRGGDDVIGLNINGSLRSQSADHNPRSGKLRQHPELHRFGDEKIYRRAYWQKRGRENIAAGLTYKGKPRKRKMRTDLATVHGTSRHVITNQERAERFMAQGLTWRGTPRKRPLSVARRWRAERRSIVVPPVNFEDVFSDRNRGVYK